MSKTVAGNLDRRITLQRSTDTQDEYGGSVKVWSDIATVWAAFKAVSDGEKVSAGEVGSTLMVRFTIRHDSAWADLSTLDRLIFEGVVFDIWGVKPLEGRRQFIEITAARRSEV